jgi:hypothetical protein
VRNQLSFLNEYLDRTYMQFGILYVPLTSDQNTTFPIGTSNSDQLQTKGRRQLHVAGYRVRFSRTAGKNVPPTLCA